MGKRRDRPELKEASMEEIKTSENVQFDVIYADGTRRHVSEGVLFEIKDNKLIFHNGTDSVPALVGVAEAAAEVVGALRLTEAERALLIYKIHNRIFYRKDADPDMKKQEGRP